MANYADFQLGLYFAGLGGELPPYPVGFAALEAAAREKMEHRLWDYVEGRGAHKDVAYLTIGALRIF